MPRCVEGVFNPEGWQRVAGGRSGAQTPGRELVGSVHPGGMPEFCDPCWVSGRLLERRPGGALRSALFSRSLRADQQTVSVFAHVTRDFTSGF
jgi:hypothetical protein